MLWWFAVGMAAVAGLLLRVLAAHGGLWTDEAWSVIYAHRARDPVGVFLRINHDNNHHLYSLWLQAIGMQAPPWLARLPAIVAGSASIILAALLVGRRSRWAGIAASILFALSPALVTFGSEARGYALMLLAFLAMLLLATRAIECGWRRATPWWLALVAALGMLSHMTMAAPVALTALWIYLDRRAALGPDEALRTTARLMGPALAATVAVIAFVFAAAAASPAGMRVGGYLPFDWHDYILALDDLAGGTAGLSALAPWLGPLIVGSIAVFVAIRPPRWLGSRGRLYALLIAAVPLAVGLLHPGNSGFARYYLSSALGLLLLAAEWIGHGLAKPGPPRVVMGGVLASFIFVSLIGDWQLVGSQRGHPDAPVQLMAAKAPAGARLALDPSRLQAIVTVAAVRTDYPLKIVAGCAPAEFFLTAPARFAAAPDRIMHCGIPMRALGSGAGTPLTGDRWVLYGQGRLQTVGPPVSGPLPSRAIAAFPAERA